MQEPIELPRAGWLPLADAAERLGVTPWQARRWVRAGRLHAELRRGPTGSHYYVPTHLVDALALELALASSSLVDARNVEPVHPLDDAALVDALLKLRAEVQQAVEFHEQTEVALREELNQIRAELAAGIEALKMARVSVEEPTQRVAMRWWRFWNRG